MTYLKQTIPMVSVNDDIVTITVWHKNNGEFVKAHSTICEIETTKSVVDIEAECDGYLFHLIEEGAQLAVNTAFAIISESNDPSVISRATVPSGQLLSELNENKRAWTKKAEIIAKQNGIEISNVLADGIIQEADVRAYLASVILDPKGVDDLVDDVYSNTSRQRILIIGGGYGAAHIIDAINRTTHQEAVGILDDSEPLHGKSIAGIKIIGSVSKIYTLLQNEQADAAILSFGNIKKRDLLFNELISQNVPFANIIDKDARIHSNVSMGVGNIVLANARIAVCTSIGDNNFLSAFVNIDHHNKIGSNCTFGPGVMTSGRVSIGNNVLFGTGIFIEPGVAVGSNSVISSGSVITVDIPEKSIVKKMVDIKIQPLP
ncbi:MAG: DapH/DapD/GlmU-related protein [Desulfuromonadaceae bacterium]|nr:DapH/DapD/GlmU-related protein [Desulfuromonadaceae bacterium]